MDIYIQILIHTNINCSGDRLYLPNEPTVIRLLPLTYLVDIITCLNRYKYINGYIHTQIHT